MDAPLLHALQAAAIGFLAGGYIALFFLHRRHSKILHEHTMSLMSVAANLNMLIKALETVASRGLPEDVRVKFDIKDTN
jgi:hypothetical protein